MRFEPDPALIVSRYESPVPGAHPGLLSFTFTVLQHARFRRTRFALLHAVHHHGLTAHRAACDNIFINAERNPDSNPYVSPYPTLSRNPCTSSNSPPLAHASRVGQQPTLPPARSAGFPSGIVGIMEVKVTSNAAVG